jgi:transcriptional regulator with XRE-family HTH domain
VHRPPHRKPFGDAIRALREEAGLTQEQLAERADVHHNFVGGVERGTMECSITKAIRIANALGVHLRDLLKDT